MCMLLCSIVGLLPAEALTIEVGHQHETQKDKGEHREQRRERRERSDNRDMMHKKRGETIHLPDLHLPSGRR